MSKSRFEVTLEVGVVVEVEDDVIAGVLNEDWRKTFYQHIKKPEDVASHIAYNFVRHGTSLSNLDGFGDCEDSDARCSNEHWAIDSVRKL